MPVLMEQLARERGVLASDGVTPCIAIAVAEATLRKRENVQCLLHILGVEMTTSGFALYTSSFGVFVQALTLVSISAIADHGQFIRTRTIN
jgi:UMF1 family MFS transporter